jgi:hypothetical protein
MKICNFDISKTYCGLQYGKSFIAKEIIKYSKEYAPDSKEIPTHVLALIYRFGKWWVFESHSDPVTDFDIPAGVRHYTLDKWLQFEHVEEFKFFPLEVEESKLEEYIGHKYGMCDIFALMKAAKLNTNGKQKDYKGDICSAFFAHGCLKIQEYYKNLPEWCITPAHIQNYLDKVGVKAVG